MARLLRELIRIPVLCALALRFMRGERSFETFTEVVAFRGGDWDHDRVIDRGLINAMPGDQPRYPAAWWAWAGSWLTAPRSPSDPTRRRSLALSRHNPTNAWCFDPIRISFHSENITLMRVSLAISLGLST